MEILRPTAGTDLDTSWVSEWINFKASNVFESPANVLLDLCWQSSCKMRIHLRHSEEKLALIEGLARIGAVSYNS